MTMKLHLGSGTNPKKDWINLDSRDLPEVDVVRDVLRGLPFDDDKFDYIFSENFMEHIPQDEVIWLMNEMWRVCKVGGEMQHYIPLAGTESFFQDPTHLSHWVPETISYFVKGHHHNKYYGGLVKPWELVKLELRNYNKELMNVVLKKC